MQIPLDRQSRQPLYQQIVQYIEHQIAAGNLPAGTLLPPIRALAERLSVSKTVIGHAYAELEALGLVAGRVGAGTIVTAQADARPPQAPAPLALPQKATGAAVYHDLLGLLTRPGMINLATNRPDPHSMPAQEFGRCLRDVIQEEGPLAFTYETATGGTALRQAICRHLVDRGMLAMPDDILVTNGSQQAIDLVVRALVGPGEWVVAEAPCYMGTLDVFAANDVRVAPVPMDQDGLSLDLLEDIFRRLRPRLLYTTPTFQNPTGSTMSLQRRQRLVELAARWGVTVLEDGVCSELELSGPAPPALRALTPQVLHCNSFSKILLPGIRLGYLVAPPAVTRRLTLLKQATDHSSANILQRALARFLDAGLLQPHLRRVLEIQRHRRTVALTALAQHLPVGCTWTQPTGGLHVWVSVPPHVDVTALYVAAVAADVGFTPGAVFFTDGAPSQYLRLSYGFETPERINAGIARIGSLLDQFPAVRQGALGPL